MTTTMKEYIKSKKVLHWILGFLLQAIFLFMGLLIVFIIEKKLNIGVKTKIFVEFFWLIVGSMLFNKITNKFWVVTKKEKEKAVEVDEEQ